MLKKPHFSILFQHLFLILNEIKFLNKKLFKQNINRLFKNHQFHYSVRKKDV